MRANSGPFDPIFWWGRFRSCRTRTLAALVGVLAFGSVARTQDPGTEAPAPERLRSVQTVTAVDPDIVVEPAGLEVVLESGASATRTLSISNTGSQPLYWSLTADQSYEEGVSKRLVRQSVGQRPDRVARIRDRLSESAEVAILVGFDAPFTPEGFLPDRARVVSQRAEILRRQDALIELVTRHGGRLAARFETIPFVGLQITGPSLDALLDEPGVTGVYEVRHRTPALDNSVPLVGAAAAHAAGVGGAGQAVAIIDTGVDATHPFLSPRVVEEACFSEPWGAYASLCPSGEATEIGPGSAAPCAVCSHGTHVAGIVAGSGPDMSGMAPEASIIAIQAFTRHRQGSALLATDLDLLRALEHAYGLRHDYSIAAINLSLGGGEYPFYCDAYEVAFQAVFSNLHSVGIAVAAASGNDGFDNALSFPACMSQVISVGNTGSVGPNVDLVNSSSNSADFLDLLAPGTLIRSSVPDGGYAWYSGTSMAAPHVAGAFALLRQHDPDASVAEVLFALQSTGRPVTDSRNGLTFPRIQVDAAMESGRRWLAAEPPAGYEMPQEGITVEVTVDASTLSEGSYEGALVIHSNDPDASDIIVPVSVTVGGGPTLKPWLDAADVIPGEVFCIDILAGSTTHPVSNLAGVDFDLTYDSGSLTFVSGVGGSFLGDAPVFQSDASVPGILSVGVAHEIPGSGSSGEGPVANVCFESGEDLSGDDVLVFGIQNVNARDTAGEPLLLQAGLLSVGVNPVLTVWPGDTNRDGLVDQADVLPVGFWWGQAGPSREPEDRGCVWRSHAVSPWRIAQAGQADATGDGLVNQEDVLCIGFNWGSAPAKRLAASRAVRGLPGRVSMNLVEEEGGDVVVEVALEGAEGIGGMALDVGYDAETMELVSAVAGDAFGSDAVAYHRIDREEGSVDVALSAKGGWVAKSEGGIATLRFRWRTAVPSGEVRLSGAHALMHSGALARPEIGETVKLSAGESVVPGALELGEVFPNPFRDEARIALNVPVSGFVRVEVFDVTGARVRTLAASEFDAGRHVLRWDGEDDSGGEVASGVYLIRMRSASAIDGRTVIHAK